ncbi:MAG: hypothetical protein ACLU9S_03150 [Oscillospiraceae bacterium]
MKIYCLPEKSPEKVGDFGRKVLEKIDIANTESSPAGLLFLFSDDCGKQKVTGHPVPERRKDRQRTLPISKMVCRCRFRAVRMALPL